MEISGGSRKELRWELTRRERKLDGCVLNKQTKTQQVEGVGEMTSLYQEQ